MKMSIEINFRFRLSSKEEKTTNRWESRDEHRRGIGIDMLRTFECRDKTTEKTGQTLKEKQKNVEEEEFRRFLR